jgi:phytanoyl-CoA hydroxylase
MPSIPLDRARIAKEDGGTKSSRARYHAPMIAEIPRDLEELKRRFEADGFVRIEAFLDEQHLQEVERELSRYLAEIAPNVPGGDIVYEPEPLADGSRAVRNLWRMEEHSAFFRELAQALGLAWVGPLVNGDATSCGVELFAKPAWVGSAVPFHQDNAYFNLEPPDALTCWIALDDSTLENGCVYYARGSHRTGLRPHKPSGVNGNSMTVASPPEPGEFEEVPGVLGRGGAILHHCVLMHRSEQNRSPTPRRGLLLVFRGSHCQVDPERARKYQNVVAQLASQRD